MKATGLRALRSTDLKTWELRGLGVETEPGIFDFNDEPALGTTFYRIRAE
jgi:hypothetical protein